MSATVSKIIPVVGKPDVRSLQAKASKIFSIFTQTQKDLEKVNIEISQLTDVKKQEAKKILDEVQILEELAAKNNNLNKKIQAFISGE